MATNNLSHPIGWVAISTGVVGLLSLLFIILFFSVGQPFGTLNDICNGLTAILAVALACLLYFAHRTYSPSFSLIALVFAFAGLVLVGVGTILVFTGKTGWFLAGLYVSAGNALIGLWLVGLNVTALQGNPWPHGLAVLGLVAGAFMMLGGAGSTSRDFRRSRLHDLRLLVSQLYRAD